MDWEFDVVFEITKIEFYIENFGLQFCSKKRDLKEMSGTEIYSERVN